MRGCRLQVMGGRHRHDFYHRRLDNGSITDRQCHDNGSTFSVEPFFSLLPPTLLFIFNSISSGYRANMLSYYTLYILCIYPVILDAFPFTHSPIHPFTHSSFHPIYPQYTFNEVLTDFYRGFTFRQKNAEIFAYVEKKLYLCSGFQNR